MELEAQPKVDIRTPSCHSCTGFYRSLVGIAIPFSAPCASSLSLGVIDRQADQPPSHATRKGVRAVSNMFGRLDVHFVIAFTTTTIVIAYRHHHHRYLVRGSVRGAKSPEEGQPQGALASPVAVPPACGAPTREEAPGSGREVGKRREAKGERAYTKARC